jgi:serine/threonine protein kinase
MVYEIFPRVVGDIIESIHELFEDDVVLIYSNTDSYVDIYASEFYVAKVFQNLDEGRSRCYTEYKNHMIAYAKHPQFMIPMHYYLMDNTSSCLVYERGFEITDVEFEYNIESVIDIILAFNNVGVIHLDTKPTNFLLNKEGNLVIHDWGLACTTKLFTNEFKKEIFLSQLRLLFVIWQSSEPVELLEKYGAREIFGLSEDTMYTDEYFNRIVCIQDYYRV